MVPKINLKARIERHSRVLQHGLYSGRRRAGKKGISLVSLIAVGLLPIYPTFASFINETSSTEFDRRDIDESSIISSYFGDGETVGDGSVFIQSKDSYLHVNAALLDNSRDVSGTKEIVEYEVKSGESIAGIADKFNITKNSIYWANDFDTSHTLQPGDVIKVPPVSGLIHTVASGETLLGLANKYEVESEDIMRQNLLLKAEDLKIGDTIIIPGAEKEVPKPEPVAQKTYASTSNTSSSSSTSNYGFVNNTAASSEYVNSGGRYNLVWRQPFSGVWGNCTWYVASYKNVNWRGNANQWMRNASAKGHPIGYTPSIGAIVQFAGSGYNPYYGHVGIVIDMTSTHIIVSDMNYRRLGEVTTRKVPINDRTIQGYIYVD